MLNYILTILPTISFISYIFIGFYILLLNPKSDLNRNFLYSCLSFALWSFGYIFINMSPNSQYLIIWGKLAHLGAIIYVPVIFKFILILTKYYNKIKYKIIFNIFTWIFPAILIYKNFIDNAIANDIPYGWFFIKQFLNVYNFSSIIFIIIWGLKTKSKREKKQAITILLGAITAIILSIISDFFLEIHGVNTIASSIVLIWIFGVWYAIVKYRFLSITPEFVNSNILSNIDEVIILLNQNKEIITMNDKTKSIFGNIINKKKLSKIIKDFDRIETKINDLLKGDFQEFSKRLQITNNEEKIILMDIKCSLVKDEFEDILGILIIGKEIKGIEHLKNIYKFTNREIDIILHIISGSTNEEIAYQLDISLNTMKRHITNIYNKLAVFNKVQLMNIAKEFDLIPNKN